MNLARRIVVIWAIDALGLWLLAWVVPGFELANWTWAIWAAAVIGLLNALARPLILVVMLPFTVLTLGLLSLVLNAWIVLLANLALPGVVVQDFMTALWIVLGLALINTLATGLLSINDDESFYRNVVARIARGITQAPKSDRPGLIIIEIDGLSEPALKAALDSGYLPAVRQWLEDDDYRVKEWDCGLPSQTSSSQAGILYGRNFGIPAFRWYEKTDQQLMVSNRPWTAAELHNRLSDGSGLLAPGGCSLTNILSGDAVRSVMTLSSLMSSVGVRQRAGNYFPYFLNPYAFSRVFVLMVWEVIREIGQRFRGWLRRPRVPATRGGSFPLLRAVSNVFVRDLTLFQLIESILRGSPIVYCTYLGYDVVAHHVGPVNRDALLTLKHLDDDLQSLIPVLQRAPRPYRLVLLSDHGQSFGATFSQRYGMTLEKLIEQALEGAEQVLGSSGETEGWGHLNALLSGVIQEENAAGRAVRRVLRRRTRDGYVEFGPGADLAAISDSEVLVCSSGNLGLIYFTAVDERLTLEEISWRYPKLIEAIVSHPGIGFALVQTAARGPVVVSRHGLRYLDSDLAEGIDPLEQFGPNAAEHLRWLSSFPNVGDIVVNSMYDPHSGEVAAFEELVGSHGGLGGDQTRAFIIHPSAWDCSDDSIDGPVGIYRLLRNWFESDESLAGTEKTNTASHPRRETLQPAE